MTEARLIRRFRFRASHHYGRLDWSEAENRRAFGAQVDPHQHDWMIEVHVTGPVDEATGFVTDVGALDASLAVLTVGWDGGDLNDVIPDVAAGAMQPSTEGLARWIHGRLEEVVFPPARLARVAVFESRDLGAHYPA